MMQLTPDVLARIRKALADGLAPGPLATAALLAAYDSALGKIALQIQETERVHSERLAADKRAGTFAEALRRLHLSICSSARYDPNAPDHSRASIEQEWARERSE